MSFRLYLVMRDNDWRTLPIKGKIEMWLLTIFWPVTFVLAMVSEIRKKLNK